MRWSLRERRWNRFLKSWMKKETYQERTGDWFRKPGDTEMSRYETVKAVRYAWKSAREKNFCTTGRDCRQAVLQRNRKKGR